MNDFEFKLNGYKIINLLRILNESNGVKVLIIKYITN